MSMPYALTLGALAFVIALLAGWPLIHFLVSRRIGKQFKVDGPSSHVGKAGTPTMGGVLILGSVLLVTVPFNLTGRISILLPLLTMFGFGVLGGIDDYMSMDGGERTGMRARFKMLGLLILATAAALILVSFMDIQSVNVPFLGKFSLGWWYVPIAVFTIVGTANAVNITDGLDTLAGGTAALAFASYGVIAYLQQQWYLASFAFTMVGATMGFLWFNAHPARLFMGDIGSLALGGSLAVVALMTGHWLLLPIIGIVFVAEAASDIIQVAYFKMTKGKRIFRMAPVHHHFELGGWAETQVTTRFMLVGMAGGMLGIALAMT